MIRTIRRLTIGLALLLAPPLAAQGGADHGRPHHPGNGRAFQLLLERRAELGLSESQAERLQVIGRRLESVNGPLRERLAAERQRFLAERRAELERMSPEQRRAEFRRMRERGRPPLPPSMRPLADEMQRNIHQAMREAHAVLTPAQRARVRRMVHEERERRAPRGRGRPGVLRPSHP